MRHQVGIKRSDYSMQRKAHRNASPLTTVANAPNSHAKHRAWFLFSVLFLLSAWLLCHSVSTARAQAPSEYQVKAGFVYNFGRFVSWPSGAISKSNFIIGVVGDDRIAPFLERATDGKTIDDKEIVVRRYKRASDIQACHILFISESERERLPKILDRVEKQPTLTVSEIDGFIARGGMINFTLEDKRVRFDINEAAANRAGLKISSKLLQLARTVKR